MQDLRNKLRKAGLVSKDQARAIKTEARQAKKRADNQKPPLLDPVSPEQLESSLKQKRDQARAQQIILNKEKAEHEKIAQIRNLIRTHLITQYSGEDRPFHFVGRDQRIRKFMTSHEMGRLLSLGKAAIVELDDDPLQDYAIVDAKCASRLEELDRSWILYWNKDYTNSDDLPTYGSGQ